MVTSREPHTSSTVRTDSPGGPFETTTGPAVHRTPEVRIEERSVHTPTTAARHDRVRWGPVWAGTLVTLAAFIVLEVTAFAFGWLTLAQGESGTTAGWITAAIACVAFLLGGATAGATVMWRGIGDALFHGLLTWVLTTVSIIMLTVLGGGALFGAVADVFGQIAGLRQAASGAPQPAEVVDTARSGAGWAVLGIALSIAAAAIGGMLGAKVWPHGRHADDTAVRER